jgi:anti-sigma B factor antagonist
MSVSCPSEVSLANIRDHLDGAIGIVELDGRLTVNDRPGLLKEAVADIVRRGAKNVLLELSGVNYIDSTRLGEIIAAHVTVARQGGRLKLVRTPHRVVELLVMAGLGDVFERFDSMDDAKKSFAQPN